MQNLGAGLSRLVISLWVFVCCATTAWAQSGPLRSLTTGDDARGWEAVGRLDINGKGFCTGALIGPDLVLTAGHCLFDSETQMRIDPAKIEFRAGWRNGQASAYRGIKQAVVHSDFQYEGPNGSSYVRNDLALLQLDQPIRNGRIIPFEITGQPRRGETVGIVSYAKDRSDAPSLQDTCDVLAQQSGVLVTSCDVDFGSSGAPIFSFDGDRAMIVSVVSAKAEIEGSRVALGTSLHVPLAKLQADMVAGLGSFSTAPQGSKRVVVGGHSRTSGAKFVKP